MEKQVLTTLLCLDRQAKSNGKRNKLQEALWMNRTAGKKIMKFLPVSVNFLIRKIRNLSCPLPRRFSNKYLRLWWIICYRREALINSILANLDSPAIKKVFDKTVKERREHKFLRYANISKKNDIEVFQCIDGMILYKSFKQSV
tara:strand:+ start:371 stop:802 length:432 start_codon:yes stop_codon:yes gene_type:complete